MNAAAIGFHYLLEEITREKWTMRCGKCGMAWGLEEGKWCDCNEPREVMMQYIGVKIWQEAPSDMWFLDENGKEWRIEMPRDKALALARKYELEQDVPVQVGEE